METFESGEKADVLIAIKLLLNLPVSSLVDAIDHPYEYKAKDIFQFSKLDDATDNLCNFLEFEEVSLSYEEAGKKLIRASNHYANIKYGENHAKTAAMLTLVTIRRVDDRKCNVISISPLGSVMTSLSKEEKNEVLRRLAIRNPFLKTLIFHAKGGEASYVEDVSKVLSGQTIIRRKHNNEIIMNLILHDEPIREKIRW